MDDSYDWLVDSLTKKVRTGSHTSFWDDTWVILIHLTIRFPRLFSTSDQKYLVVGKVVLWEDGVLVWVYDGDIFLVGVDCQPFSFI